MIIIISIAFFCCGVAGLLIAHINETSVTSIGMCFVVSISLFIGHFISKREREKSIEREFEKDRSEEEQVKIKEELLKKNKNICEEINKKFVIPKCSKCNDSNFRLLEFNSQLDGIKIKCKTCNKTMWIKSDLEIDITTYEYYMNDSIHTLYFNRVSLVSNITDHQQKKRHNIKASVKQEVWNRDGGKCVKCGSRVNLEYDHIIPVSKG